MCASVLSSVVATAARAAGTADPISDGELLRRFVRTHDGNAFTELVRRLGPMVLGVCRRGGDTHLAEDAFQAAFVVLARRAADVRPPEAVRGWLYGVAVRTTREARTVAARRRSREQSVPVVPDQPAETTVPADGDALRVLDEVIAGLPEHLRAALVLCELKGASRKLASDQLGVPEGTLSSRLAKARRLLAARLRARGISAPAVGLAVLVEVAVPPQLVAQTSALLNPTSPLTGTVGAISNGVLRSMLLHKLTLGSVCVALVSIACLAMWSTLPLVTATEPPKPIPAVAFKITPAEDKQPPAPKTADPGRLLVWKETKFVFVTPDGKEESAFDPEHPDKRVIFNEPILSPDGKQVAFMVNEDPPTDQEGNRRRHLYYRALDGKTPGVKIELNPMTAFWDRDSKALISTEFVPGKDEESFNLTVWRIDVATKEKTKLDLPGNTVAYAASADGKTFVTTQYDLKAKEIHLALVSRDGKDVTKLCQVRTEGANPRLSPDGTKILFEDLDPDEKPAKDTPPLHRLFVVDCKTKARTRLAEVPLNAMLIGYCWSPDGKRIAYSWKQVQPGVPLAANTENINDPKLNTETESHLVVCDANGKNPKTVMTIKAEFAPRITIGSIDWR